MNKYEQGRCSREAEFFKALGHPTRVWIVQQLADGVEHCVCEFVDLVDADYSTISQHLAVLKRAGVVIDDKRGRQVFYRLLKPCVIQVLACMVEGCIE